MDREDLITAVWGSMQDHKWNRPNSPATQTLLAQALSSFGGSAESNAVP